MDIHLDTTPRELLVGPFELRALLGIPANATGMVIFAHGSGSGRLSPRNNHVAGPLRRAGLATLLIDLLTPVEEANRANVFHIALLAERLATAAQWVHRQPELQHLPIGYFGASTGAGAALVAATFDGPEISAVVSRGGRPDLAGSSLPLVRAPTLLLVGSLDGPVIGLNRQAFAALTAPKELVIVEGAGHLFEEPGTLDQVITHASRWFATWFAKA
jgi:putative phosphoribosyl transferase